MTGPTSSPADRLRGLLSESRRSGACLMMPGAFNALCGLAVREAGFQACYVSGAATSVCAGVPDVGLLTLEHFARAIQELHAATGLPVLADADTGFGESEMVRRTVVEYHRAGAAGLHIEDQVFPKRCGHLDGKSLIRLDHAVEKVRAAVDSSRAVGRGGSPGLVICARTDARGVDGLDAAVERAAQYLGAGAEMIFPEGLTSEAEFGEFAGGLRRAAPRGDYHLLANMTEFGKTPYISAAEFGRLGYSCAIYPVSMLRVAMKSVTAALARLKTEGSVKAIVYEGGMQSRQELYQLIGYTPGEEWVYPAR